MKKLTYTYSSLSKQAWFYSGILYLILTSIVYILVFTYRLKGFYNNINLPLILFANALGIAFFYLLSLGHKVCYSIYDDEKITYRNRLLRKSKTFYFKEAKAIIFDLRGIKFYKDEEDLKKKLKPDFYVPFFRNGRINAMEVNNLFKLMQNRSKINNEENPFNVYKAFITLPGYGRKWKYVSFAYACLTILVLINCTKALAIILGIIASH